MAADLETPEELIFFEPPPFIEEATFSPHFQHQLLEYFDRLDEFSTLYSLIAPPTADFTRLTIGQPTSQYIPFQNRPGSTDPVLPFDAVPAGRIREQMMDLRRRMLFLAHGIRERINIIGSHRVSVGTGRRLFLCENIEDIRSAEIYRRLMPPNSPEIHIVVDTRNYEYETLAQIAHGVQFFVVNRSFEPRYQITG